MGAANEKALNKKAKSSGSENVNGAEFVKMPQVEPAKVEHHDFTPEQIDKLRKSFESLKPYRDEVSTALLETILQIDGAKDKFTRRRSTHNEWVDINLGMMTLSGIERILLRLDKEERMKMFLKWLMERHGNVYSADETMMMTAFENIELVMVSSFKEYLPNDPIHLEWIELWKKLFQHIRFLARQGSEINH